MMSKEMRQAVLEDVPTILALAAKTHRLDGRKRLVSVEQDRLSDRIPCRIFCRTHRGKQRVSWPWMGNKAWRHCPFDVDPRWDNDKDAYYVHHLATDPAYPGLGREILTFAETYARNAGKEVLRLDSQKVNDDLSRYYEALGYPAVGECIDGAYVGIKREKPLNG